MPSNCFPDNGGYAQWGDWSECSVTCGTGHRSRRRYCTNPPPSPGGKDCSGLGPDTLTEECNSGGCPGKKMIISLTRPLALLLPDGFFNKARRLTLLARETTYDEICSVLPRRIDCDDSSSYF